MVPRGGICLDTNTIGAGSCPASPTADAGDDCPLEYSGSSSRAMLLPRKTDKRRYRVFINISCLVIG
jgi:hypothetical protein